MGYADLIGGLLVALRARVRLRVRVRVKIRVRVGGPCRRSL